MKIIATVLFASLISFAACKKDDKKIAPAPTPTTVLVGSAAEAAKPTEAPKAAEVPAGEAPKADPAADPAAAAGVVMTVEQAGAMATGVMTKFADAIKGANGDCPKMATALGAIKEEMTAMVKAGKAFDTDEVKKKEFDEKFGKKLTEVMMPAMEGLMKCQDNADVTNFMKSMDAK